MKEDNAWRCCNCDQQPCMHGVNAASAAIDAQDGAKHPSLSHRVSMAAQHAH